MKFLPDIEVGSLYIDMTEDLRSIYSSREILLKSKRERSSTICWPNSTDPIEIVCRPTHHRWSENGVDYISRTLPVKIMRTK